VRTSFVRADGIEALARVLGEEAKRGGSAS